MNPPQYYKIRLSAIPRILYGFSNQSRSYRWKYDANRPNICEICFVQSGTVSELREDGEHTYEEGSVFTFVKNRPFEHYSKDAFYREITLGFEPEEAPVPATQEEIALQLYRSTEAILPDQVTDPAVRKELSALLLTAIHHLGDRSDPVRNMAARACLLEMLTVLTRYSLFRARSRQYGAYKQQNRYCSSACRYISDHLAETIRVEDVARHAGVGYRYLSKLFRLHMGITLVDYINREKIRRVSHHLTEGGMTLEEAGFSVGIPDVKYLSRLFRRYTGMTASEYKRIGRE